MHFEGLICTGCGRRFHPGEKLWVCRDCGSLLDAVYDFDGLDGDRVREELNRRPRTLWRYREFLPVQDIGGVVSLGEGSTPLVRAGRYGERLGLKNLFFKIEYLNPTGSFKDRGATVLVSKAKELGVKVLIEDSSGNAGSSIAAYSARAGIECMIYVPSYTSPGKLFQMEMYGARVVRVLGSRDEVALKAEEACNGGGGYYGGHNKNPYFLEGNKTFAYEVVEDLDWKAPDHIIFPVGGGSLFLGSWKGFQEFKGLGWIDGTPRLHCIQSMACKPIVEAYQRGLEYVEGVEPGFTVAGGIRVGRPPRGRLILKALRESGGVALAVSDEAILTQQRCLAKEEGIFAEATSCAALSGLQLLLEEGVIERDEVVVIPVTGFGLKESMKVKES